MDAKGDAMSKKTRKADASMIKDIRRAVRFLTRFWARRLLGNNHDKVNQ